MRRTRNVLACLALTGAVLGLYAPALRFTLAGDDYQMFQLAHRAIHRPAFLLADLDTFWRPSTTWTLAATHLLVPFSAEAHHAVSLAIYLAAAVLLLAVARKAGLGLPASTAVALIWACSPFTSEPALSVASRHETLLFAGWLALALVWPRGEQRWSRGRIAAAVGCTLLAACSKETWVVTPALVFVYDFALRPSSPRDALRPAMLFSIPAAVFTAVRFALFPTLRGYFSSSPTVLAKVPHELAAFLHFEELLPLGFSFTWRGALAVAVVAGLAVIGLKRSKAASALGLALLIVPTAPTFFVPYLPTRYTSIPYAGFLILAAAVAEAAIRGVHPRLRKAAVAGVGAFAVVVWAAGALTVRADLVDGARLSAAHAQLLREAAAVAPGFPLDRPVLVVRAEDNNPVREIMMSPHGLPKIIFARLPDPDGLIDAAALFEWVLGRNDIAVVRCDDGEKRFRDRPGAILEHRRDDFVWITMNAPNLGAQAQRARLAGFRDRVIMAERFSKQLGGSTASP